MPIQRSSNFSNSQNVYVGLDVHLKQWNVCIYQGGILRKTFQQSAEAEVLQSYLHRVYPGKSYFSAYEAGVCGCSVHYALEAAGIRNIIFNAADISQTHKERVRKTDAVDAAKIARALANNELRSVHIPPQWRLSDRNLLRLRATLVSDMKRRKARLRHFLHVNGIHVPAEFAPGRWPLAFIAWLKKTAAEDTTSTGRTLTMMVESIEGAMADLRKAEKQLRELMATPPYSEDFAYILSVPGVGRLTATTLLLECGDLSDFHSAESFCAYVGLVPDINRSDEHQVRCGITRRRHRSLRYMLTECAWRAVRKDSHLSSLYAGYTRRMPPTKAIVKIANKLAKIIKFVLRNKTEYVQPA